jgi:Plasmid maintenance system antidote protein
MTVRKEYNEKLYQIGQIIKKLRKSKDLTQTELATAINVDERSISNIETGRTQITIEFIIKLYRSNVFERSLSELLQLLYFNCLLLRLLQIIVTK